MSFQNIETGFLHRVVHVEGTDYRYQVYVPGEYASRESWPVILSLHGSGERGRDGQRPVQIGIAAAIRSHPARYPAIVVFPQAPLTTAGWHGVASDIALAALDRTVEEFRTDRARIYITGLSMGGNGAWLLALRDPARFAAAAIVCGFVNGLVLADGTRFPPVLPDQRDDSHVAVAQKLKHIPIWILHGELDPVVPVEESRRMAEELQQAGADVRYTEFAKVGHNAWQPAYDMEALPQWLLSHRLSGGHRGSRR